MCVGIQVRLLEQARPKTALNKASKLTLDFVQIAFTFVSHARPHNA